MKVNIIRGKNQIGGNIIEISTEKTKILLDAGLGLDGGNTLPDIHGLFDFAGYDAIFVSHFIPTIWGLSIVRTRIFLFIWGRAAITLSERPTVTKSSKR